MTEQTLEIRCPRCQWFVMRLRIRTIDAELEVNCPSVKCQTTLVASIENSRIAVEAMPKKKKA
jgi:phage FluMu protein Com